MFHNSDKFLNIFCFQRTKLAAAISRFFGYQQYKFWKKSGAYTLEKHGSQGQSQDIKDSFIFQLKQSNR